MNKKVLVIMDPIESINVQRDTTYLLMLAAQEIGYELFYLMPGSLSVNFLKPVGRIAKIKILHNKEPFYDISEIKDTELSFFDCVLMRTDPPINSTYIYMTYILDMLDEKNIKVINSGSSLRNYNEKLITLNFPKYIPDTILTSNKRQIENFKIKHQRIILKHLNLMGGRSIYFLDKDDKNLNVIFEDMTNFGKNYILAQEYISEAKTGDKRIIIVNGEVIKEAVIRVPNDKDHRASTAAGGSIEKYYLKKEEIEICQDVADFLYEKNILFAGIDMIGNKITEINITSPTCVAEINKFHNIDLGKKFWECIK